MAEFSLPVKVYIEDTDAGGIVYHANYLKFMERSRTEFITRLGCDRPATLGNSLLLVVHSMRIDFLQAGVLGEQLEVATRVRKVARSYVEFEQIVRRAGGASLCRADVKIACVKKPALKPAAMPDNLRDLLQSALVLS
jgi:4-hydroxybenzoyl-CoA thioesterase